MTKNVFDLITAIVTGLEVIADGVCVYLGVTGKLDKATASAIASSVTIVGGAVLGVEVCGVSRDGDALEGVRIVQDLDGARVVFVRHLELDLQLAGPQELELDLAAIQLCPEI